MNRDGDRRLIEDYLPIEAISKEASREKNVRKGKISTLHLWWARRPLVACRAAVYGALVPASKFSPENGNQEKRHSPTRANAAKFVERLCQYPGNPQVIAEAQHHILTAHAVRLSCEIAHWKAGKSQRPGWVEEFKFVGDKVTEADITAGFAPRPKVLDMFAGGGSIPLEALRLGCEAYALDLNPVAYIIELCTLVYPQKYGKPDPAVRGMAGPKDTDGLPTWGGLASEVHYWADWILKKVKAEIGDLYPLIPDPSFKGKRPEVQIDFRDIGDTLVQAAEQSHPEPGWKAIVKTYLTLEFCDHPESGCPLPALAPELTRVDQKMRKQILPQLVNYKDRMLPFMPGRRTADKERAFFSIFATMAGAIEIARMLPEPAMREKVLAAARDFLLSSF